jgi:hypothetical protein
VKFQAKVASKSMASISNLDIGAANSVSELIELVHKAEERFKNQMWF